MKIRLLCFALVLALAAALPFAGEPSYWTVKITPSSNCSKGQTPTSPSNSSVLEGNTGIYGCYATDDPDSPYDDYYVTCNATHLLSHLFNSTKRKEPCRGTLVATKAIPLGVCVDYDWTGTVTGQMYTYNCFGMWCNSTCDNPPCPLDFPCPQETACCLNDNRYDFPCLTADGCAAEIYPESWFWPFLRKVLLLASLACLVMYAWKAGWLNICPWRRPYSTLYGEMA